MHTVTTIGLDIAKSVFQVHCVDVSGQVVIRRRLKRRYLLAFFEKLPPCSGEFSEHSRCINMIECQSHGRMSVIVPYVRGCGTTRFLSSAAVRNGQPSVVAVDTIALLDALKIDKAIFGGFDWGGRTADIVAALWPERCKALVSVSGYLLANREANKLPLPPKAELQWWYQYYFATERGVLGYDKYRHDFGKLIWQIASPKWDFDDATFDRTAASFNNPDYVAIVIHNYRFRLSLAEGEPQYEELENRLAKNPVVAVPTITLEGDANGAPHYPDDTAYRKFFSSKYVNRIITGGIGHNLPQEAPQAFAQAIVDVDGY